MFASNFPADSLVGDFDTIFSGFLAATATLPRSDRDRLFHDNARRIYRL
ncbi:putative TIM-barrel fold metal-dependent hydrolase [Bosea sp. OAE506]